MKKLCYIFVFLLLSLFLFSCAAKNEEKNDTKYIETKAEYSKETTEYIIESEEKTDTEKVDANNDNNDNEETSESVEDNVKDSLINDIMQANTNDNLLKNYISYHIYMYGMNKDGVNLTYMEGYQDRQGNKVLKLGANEEGKEIDPNKLPYLVSINNKKYVKVEDKESAALPKDYFLNTDDELNKNIIEHMFNNKSIMIDKYDSYDISDKNNASTITLTINVNDNTKSKIYNIIDEKYIDISQINTFIVDINYNKNTLIISDFLVAGIDKDNKIIPLCDCKIKYGEDVLSPVKFINKEEGEVVSFDLTALEKANTYEVMMKEINSLKIKKENYVNDKIDNIFDIYVDTDDYIVVNDAPGSYHVKYEKKWYDILDDLIERAGKYSEYEVNPIIQVVGNKSLINPNDKIITSYGKNDNGVLIQEYTNENKIYRRETLFSLDDNCVRNIKIYEMDGDLEGSTICKIFVELDADTPNSLNNVMDFAEDGEED